MRRLGGLVLLVCSFANADDGPSGLTLHTHTRRSEQPTEPLLHLDYELPVSSMGLGATTEHETTVLALGPRTRMIAEGNWWQGTLSPQPFGSNRLDDLAHGWRAAYELSYDLGLFRVGASVAMGHVDSRFERGTYRIVGVSAYRTFRLSRWMLAWISLSAGHQTWIGTPPPGESDNTTVMLSIGTTFR